VSGAQSKLAVPLSPYKKTCRFPVWLKEGETPTLTAVSKSPLGTRTGLKLTKIRCYFLDAPDYKNY
ncbi:MAG: hypothetical protein WCS77_07345, partial [Elusimicrobiaceae bacterium]